MASNGSVSARAEFLGKIQALLRAPAYSAAVVKTTFASELEFKGRSAGDEFYIIEASGRPGDSVRRVEIRAPNGSDSGEFLLLEVSPDLGIGLAEIQERFGRNIRFTPASPHSRKGSPSYFYYEFEDARLSFGLQPGKGGD